MSKSWQVLISTGSWSIRSTCPITCIIINIHRDRKDFPPAGRTILPGDQLTLEIDAQDIEKLYEPLVSMANIY